MNKYFVDTTISRPFWRLKVVKFIWILAVLKHMEN